MDLRAFTHRGGLTTKSYLQEILPILQPLEKLSMCTVTWHSQLLVSSTLYVCLGKCSLNDGVCIYLGKRTAGDSQVCNMLVTWHQKQRTCDGAPVSLVRRLLPLINRSQLSDMEWSHVWDLQSNITSDGKWHHTDILATRREEEDESLEENAIVNWVQPYCDQRPESIL